MFTKSLLKQIFCLIDSNKCLLFEIRKVNRGQNLLIGNTRNLNMLGTQFFQSHLRKLIITFSKSSAGYHGSGLLLVIPVNSSSGMYTEPRNFGTRSPDG